MPTDFDQRLAEAYRTHQSGELDKADRLYRDLLSRDPLHSETNNLVGMLCLQRREPVKAIRHIQRALRSAPGEARSHANLGVAYKDLERWQECASAFAEAARLDPANNEFISSQGNALRLAGRPGEAVAVLEDALRRTSGSKRIRHNLALAQNDLGAMHVREGNPAQATKHFRRSLELDPKHPQALLNLALTLEQAGELEGAARYYKAAITAQPSLADAHFQLAHLRNHRSSDGEIEAIRQLAGQSGLPLGARIKLAYGLGFALESAGDYAGAFHSMAQAHRLQAPHSPFSLGAETARFEQIRSLFNTEHVGDGPFGSDDPRPLFICGMPRSGTTLTEQVLSSHPDVFGTGEQMALARIARGLSMDPRLPFPNGLKELSKGALEQAARHYLQELTPNAGDARLITDTTPMNFMYIGLAAKLFSNARFIVCLRDPMDNCLSLFRQMLTGGNEYSHRLEDLGGFYRLHRDLVEHWKNSLGDRLMLVNYENLVLENEQTVRKLLEFCGLPFESACLSPHLNPRTVRSPSAAQVRQPVYATSIGAWKNYRDQLGPLQESLGLAWDSS